MSYLSIATCAADTEFLARITAASAQEGADQPEAAAYAMRWEIASASDIEAAYASALAAGNPHPGGDESVITDGMILANVQAQLTPP